MHLITKQIEGEPLIRIKTPDVIRVEYQVRTKKGGAVIMVLDDKIRAKKLARLRQAYCFELVTTELKI